MKNLVLKCDVGNLKIALDDNVKINNKIVNALPMSGKAKKIEGEIFYLIDLDIKFDGTEKEKFEVGDIVYWRSQKTAKYAIAIFYDNTKFDSFKSPTAASPAIKIGKLLSDYKLLKNINNDTDISICSNI